MNKMQRFVLNGLILTATSLLMNGIGVWFGIYVSNKIGTQAMGTFQLIMSVYSFAITFGTSGIGLTVTRLITEEEGRSQSTQNQHEFSAQKIHAVMMRCSLYSLGCSCLATALLFCFAPLIGVSWLQDPQTVLPLKIIAISLPMVAISAVIGGYFTAVRRVYKNAAIQIGEQLVRIGFTILSLSFLTNHSLESICTAIVASNVAAEFLSLLVSILLYRLEVRKLKRANTPVITNEITRRMISIAMPVAASACIRSGLVTAKNLLVPISLGKFGLSGSASLSIFGLLHGVVLPVVLFPSSLISSFSNLLIPELSQMHARDHSILKSRSIQNLIGRMLQLNLLFSIASAGILYAFAAPLANMVSGEPGTAFYIRILAPLVPIMYLDNCVDCMLKGLNEQLSSMRYNIIDAAISLIMVITLLPIMGMNGYLVVIFASELLNFVLSFHRLVAISKFRFGLLNEIVKPICCIIAAVLAVREIQSLFSPIFNFSLPMLILLIGITLAAYSILLIVSRAVRKNEFAWVRGILKVRSLL